MQNPYTGSIFANTAITSEKRQGNLHGLECRNTALATIGGEISLSHECAEAFFALQKCLFFESCSKPFWRELVLFCIEEGLIKRDEALFLIEGNASYQEYNSILELVKNSLLEASRVGVNIAGARDDNAPTVFIDENDEGNSINVSWAKTEFIDISWTSYVLLEDARVAFKKAIQLISYCFCKIKTPDYLAAQANYFCDSEEGKFINEAIYDGLIFNDDEYKATLKETLGEEQLFDVDVQIAIDHAVAQSICKEWSLGSMNARTAHAWLKDLKGFVEREGESMIDAWLKRVCALIEKYDAIKQGDERQQVEESETVCGYLVIDPTRMKDSIQIEIDQIDDGSADYHWINLADLNKASLTAFKARITRHEIGRGLLKALDLNRNRDV